MVNVAFFTFGILREAADHSQMQAFWDRGPHNFEGAEQSDGFIDRSRPKPESEDYDWGEATVRQFFREAEFGRAQQQFQIQKFIAPKAQTCLSFAGISCNLIAENPQLRRFLCLANSNNAPI